MSETPNPYRWVGEKLLEPAGPEMWPLAIIYFNTVSKSLAITMAPAGAGLLHGKGWSLGSKLQELARQLVAQQSKQAKEAAKHADQHVDEGSGPNPSPEHGGPAGARPA